jgi:hypothetical protein
MTIYNVEIDIVDHIQVEAETMEEAWDEALQTAVKIYDVDPSMVTVGLTKEVK